MVHFKNLLVYFLAGCPVLVLGGSRPYDFGGKANTLTVRQAGDATIFVDRLGNGTGPVPQRPEIRRLKEDEYGWNLYILALSILQWTDSSLPDSWYKIAGIHGYPFEPWNGVVGVNTSMGYCQHASVLFPTWHRPYMSLVEQQLYLRANWAAEQFRDPNNQTEREAYLNAARKWRMPYWDWALEPEDGSSVYLAEFGDEDINIYGPNGWQRIANPLYSYHFNEDDMLSFNYRVFRSWNETKRVPSSIDGDAVSLNQNASLAMDAALPNLQQRLFNLFTAYDDFGAFGNKDYNAEGNDADFESIESVHDQIHLTVGRRGHMEYIIYSAFDPIFYLHHANVDRLTAMWQILNPFSYVTPWPASEATFTSAVGELQDMDTPLTPFYASEGSFWTSRTARETTVLGYEYEDTAGFSLSTPSDAERVDDLRRVIREKYGRSSPVSLASQKKKRSLAERMSDDNARDTFRKRAFESGSFVPDLSHRSPVPCPPTSSIIKNSYYTEWIANVRLRNSDVNGPATVFFFLGAVPEDPEAWQLAPNLVGSLGVFAMEGTSNPDSEVTGTVPMTAALMKMVSGGLVPSMDPEDMESYLSENLSFRIAGADDNPMDTSQMQGLCIKIASARVRAPSTDSELPKWGEMETRISMT